MDARAYPQPQPFGHNYRAAKIRAVRDHLFPAGRPGDDSCCDVMLARLWDQLTTEADRAEAGDV